MTTMFRRMDKLRSGLARITVSVFFFLNGLMSATMSTRLPEIQMKLALPSGQLGLALLGCTVGGLLAMNIASRLSKRYGSNVICIVATLGMGITLPLIAVAPTLSLLFLVLAFFGASNGAMDITINIQGSDIEQAYDRPILNAFHACFSVGSLVGASLGSILAALHVSPDLHFLAIAICTCAGLIGSSRWLLLSRSTQNERKRPTQKRRSLHFSRPLILLGVIAFCAFLSIGAIFDWGAVYLSGTLHTGAGLAATGFTAFLLCMTLGRSVGDRLAMRFGSAMLVRCACSLAAIGLILALVAAWTPMVLFGLGLVGVGLSVPFPLVVSAAGRLAQHDTGTPLATVTTWGYFGMIVGPPVIGFIADRVGLRLSLALVVFLCVLAALCAPALNIATVRETVCPEADVTRT